MVCTVLLWILCTTASAPTDLSGLRFGDVCPVSQDGECLNRIEYDCTQQSPFNLNRTILTVGETARGHLVRAVHRMEVGQRSGNAGGGRDQASADVRHRLSEVQVPLFAGARRLHALHVHPVQVRVLLRLRQAVYDGRQMWQVGVLWQAGSALAPSAQLSVLFARQGATRFANAVAGIYSRSNTTTYQYRDNNEFVSHRRCTTSNLM